MSAKDDPNCLPLTGDWSMTGVTEQLSCLLNKLPSLLEASPKPAPALALDEVEELDVCGCQLLALFIRALQQQGFTPLIADVPAGLSAKIASLGFADLLQPQLATR